MTAEVDRLRREAVFCRELARQLSLRHEAERLLRMALDLEARIAALVGEPSRPEGSPG
jgi:hypothetical protein